MKAKRAPRLTKRETAALWLKQDGKCGCGCGERLDNSEGVIGEHTFPVALGNAAKADALYRKPCALRKTNGVRGDLNQIAHTKRLANGRTQYDDRKAAGGTRIPSRGFEGWRDFQGNIVRKDQRNG